MSATIEDLTINYEEDGVQIVKETGKEILSKGAWTTILYRYNNLDRKTAEFGKDMYTIRRYQKKQGEYVMKSKFNISSTEQAKKIIEILDKWTSKE
jgi:lipoate synthase